MGWAIECRINLLLLSLLLLLLLLLLFLLLIGNLVKKHF